MLTANFGKLDYSKPAEKATESTIGKLQEIHISKLIYTGTSV